MKYCFVFVCQQGELEIKSLLLAASLTRYLRCAHELVAAIPTPEETWGRPSEQALKLCAELGVRTVAIANPIGSDYPIGNKLACLGIETDADKLVFMDSDMLCLREFVHHSRFELPFNAKSADLATFSLDDEHWRSAYAALGLSLPQARVVSTVSGQIMQTYYNAGFVAAHRELNLAEAWIEAARRIDADERITNKRPWLDQIALPVALAKRGVRVDCLDERYNYPAHLKPLSHAELPFFCHYHWPSVLRAEPRAYAFVRELIADVPGLAGLIENQESESVWHEFLKPETAGRPVRSTRHDASSQAANLLITGIPRSGTSHVCKLIHSASNAVVINEPAEIFGPLTQQAIPWGVATHYRHLRREILDGRPVMNKLANGEFIEDTALIDTQEPYYPKVNSEEFLLGTKNTLAYLARVPQLRRAMPEALIVACIRHPLDTIASWKTTFSHLANADMESQLLGNSRDPLLSEPQRQRLREIADTERPALKRALMWRHLAETLLDQGQHLLLIRYETMVANPVVTLQRIFDALPASLPMQLNGPMIASTPRYKRDVLDEEDLAAISGICAQTAAELGYDLF